MEDKFTILEDAKHQIKKLLDQERFNEIYELCDKDFLRDNAAIQTLKIIALMREGRNEEALDYVEGILAEKYNQELEDKRILLVQVLYGSKEALDECNKEINSDKKVIQFRKAKLLREFNRIDEALEICDKYATTDPEYVKKDKFVELRRRIIRDLNAKTNLIDTKEAILLTKIYANKIKKEEIENSDIDEWKKALLLLAYYEKINKSEGLRLIKKLKVENFNNTDRIRRLNDFYSKFSSKKSKLTDIGKYEELLGCRVNFDLAMQLNNQEEKVEKKVEDTTTTQLRVENKKSKKEKKQKVMVGSTGTVVNSRYANTNNSSNSNKSANTSDKKENQVVLIKDYFRTEVDEVRKYLYRSMADDSSRRSATNAYDLFENMVNKSVEDKAALTRFRNLLEKMIPAIKVEMDLVDKKIKKL